MTQRRRHSGKRSRLRWAWGSQRVLLLLPDLRPVIPCSTHTAPEASLPAHSSACRAPLGAAALVEARRREEVGAVPLAPACRCTGLRSLAWLCCRKSARDGRLVGAWPLKPHGRHPAAAELASCILESTAACPALPRKPTETLQRRFDRRLRSRRFSGRAGQR